MTTVKKIFMEIVRALLFCCILSLLMTDFAASQANLSPCIMMTDRGPCKSNYKMFAYDSYDQQCKEFQYSGCGGNPNRFSTYEECMSACKPTIKRNLTSEFDLDEIETIVI
ncbi:isoinhibitor K [Drosophila mojavensis]|uniref:Uncharacterized protein, isoform A n=1 Tax=Drosophila mojavensis TaxID=7230 RepID=A0A0Q9XFF8_DROMO|nr:isoinhibitor K [Drosophila mojavensis]KRG02291.1 uncharacterized protein Dmoj_GI26268, isoform A [Drosophila mojavensis]